MENFGIRPLPNLEAKFVAANSLIGLKKNNSLFVTNIIDIEEQLQKANHKIFSAKTYKTKRKYREILKTLRREMVEELAEIEIISNDQIEQLASWDMFDQNSFASFFDPEWMFGVSTGFDIVIGNPPYIQLQLNGGELGKMYEDSGFQSFTSTGDIYCLFYERGHQLLKADGHLCYITSNKWMRAAYGEKLRTFLASKTNPLLLIDFAGVKVFESATVDTNILLFEKAKNAHHTICAATSKQNRDSLKNLSVFVQQQGTFCDFSGGDSWVIMTPIEQSIKRKIEAVGVPLKDWDIQINYGIKTGYNDAFIITSTKRDEILANCKTEEERSRTDEIIRPILRGRDIKRYGYNWAELWLINTHNGVKGRIPRVRIEDYPAIKAHLDHYWSKIKDRADQGDTPYNLRNCAYLEDFFKPKVMYPNMTKFIPFYYDVKGFFQNDKSFMITGHHIAYLTAFLNSSLFKFCFLNNFPELQGGTRELRKVFFDKIPVKDVPHERDQQYATLIMKMQEQPDAYLAKEIDNMLFEDYDLTQEEQATIGFVEIV